MHRADKQVLYAAILSIMFSSERPLPCNYTRSMRDYDNVLSGYTSKTERSDILRVCGLDKTRQTGSTIEAAGVKSAAPSYAYMMRRASGFVCSLIAQQQSSVHPETGVHWADFGGGLGVAQREVYGIYHDSGQLHTTNVDTYPYYVIDTTDQPHAVLNPAIGRTLPVAASFCPPRHVFVLADAATAKLPQAAHVSTSVYSIPYWDRPLEGIANIYNQLHPNGVMGIATDCDYLWTAGIRDTAVRANGGSDYQPPMIRFAKELADAGIDHAVSGMGKVDYDERMLAYSGLFIRRMPDTALRVTAQHKHTSLYADGNWLREYNKIAAYDTDPAVSPLTVV